MNKILNINLGGYPFTIDDNAYEHLSSYLKTIHKHFKNSEGYEEITSDIETRIAELFQESLGNHSIVTHKMVREAISIMGSPEEFGAEPIEETADYSNTSSGQKKKSDYKTGKRLFRDSEEQVVGGVCSGIAAYFGIEDPLWVRLAFAAFIITGGIGFPAYLILWAVIPEAKTSSDRLAMKGDPINVSNIAKTVEDGVEQFTDKITEITDSWDSSGKKKNFTGGKDSTEFKQTLNEGMTFLGKNIRSFLEVFSKVIKPIIFIVGFALIIAFTVVWLVSIISFFVGFPFLQFIVPNQSWIAYMGVLNLLLFVGIPILSMILLASRLVFRTKFNIKWSGGLTAFYILNVISLFGIAGYIGSQFSMGAESFQSSERIATTEETLNISFSENPYDESLFNFDGKLSIADNKLVNQLIHIAIEKAEGNEFVLIKEGHSRGKGLNEAKTLSKAIRHSVDIKGNELNIQPYFLLNQGEKFRGQHLVLTLQVPAGKSINFDNTPWTIRSRIDYLDAENHRQGLWPQKGQIFKMEEKGLVWEGMRPRRGQNRNLDFKDFSKLQIEGAVNVLIERGNDYLVELNNDSHLHEKVEIKQFDQVLKVSTDLNSKNDVQLRIVLPSLSELTVENTRQVEVMGFEEAKMAIYSEIEYDMVVNVEVENMEVTLEGNSELDLRGKGEKLTARLKDRSQLDADRFMVSVADITVKDKSQAQVAVSDTLRKKAKDDGKVKVEVGEPVVLEK